MSRDRIPSRMRRLVRARAGGLCEYCRAPEWMAFQEHQVDHIVARSHGGRTRTENLALACGACNRAKGANPAAFDPLTGRLTRLFNPRTERWDEHFRFVGLRVQPLTGIGRATARLLRLNGSEQIERRRALARYGALGVNQPPLD